MVKGELTSVELICRLRWIQSTECIGRGRTWYTFNVSPCTFLEKVTIKTENSVCITSNRITLKNPSQVQMFAATLIPSMDLIMYRRTFRSLMLMFTLQTSINYSLTQWNSWRTNWLSVQL